MGYLPYRLVHDFFHHQYFIWFLIRKQFCIDIFAPHQKQQKGGSKPSIFYNIFKLGISAFGGFIDFFSSWENESIDFQPLFTQTWNSKTHHFLMDAMVKQPFCM